MKTWKFVSEEFWRRKRRRIDGMSRGLIPDHWRLNPDL
jgi:hypothetical protein